MFVIVKANVSGTASVRGAEVLFANTDEWKSPAAVPINNIIAGVGGIYNFVKYNIADGATYFKQGDTIYILADTAVEAQTWTTIDLIARLIIEKTLKPLKINAQPGLDNVAQVRVYIKHAADIPKVKRICNLVFPGIPVLFLESDVCRDGWLVEIEGTATFMIDASKPNKRPLPALITEIPLPSGQIDLAILTAA